MAKRILIGLGVVTVASALAYLLLDAILATFIAILVLSIVAVLVMASDWEQHSTFEQRELARARKRAAKRERTQEARDRDRARWQAHQAKKAARQKG